MLSDIKECGVGDESLLSALARVFSTEDDEGDRADGYREGWMDGCLRRGVGKGRVRGSESEGRGGMLKRGTRTETETGLVPLPFLCSTVPPPPSKINNTQLGPPFYQGNSTHCRCRVVVASRSKR